MNVEWVSQLQWAAIVPGFAGGLFAAWGAQLVSHVLHKKREATSRLAATRFEVFMLLLRLNSAYFWIVCNEMHKRRTRYQQLEEVYKASWEIAEKLRSCDGIENLAEIMDVLFSETRFKTAMDRYKKLGSIIDRLASVVNPRYTVAIRRISDENVQHFEMTPSKTPPCSFGCTNDLDFRTAEQKLRDELEEESRERSPA